MTKRYPAPGEPGYDELLLELMILAVQRQGHRPEMPREFVVVVREIERLRERIAELEAELNAWEGWNATEQAKRSGLARNDP